MLDTPLRALVDASLLGGTDHPMVDVALCLVEHGWPVFPCGQDKAPLVSGGFKARSTDLAQVRRWWELHPDALPGICPGDQGYAALDVDSEKAATAVDSAGYWPGGFAVVTGGTSTPFPYRGKTHQPLHIYIQAAEQPRIPGVVVRYLGGYVIAPGARRGTRLYQVVEEGEPGLWQSERARVKDTLTSFSYDGVDLARVALAVEWIPNTEETNRDQYVALAHMIRGAAGEAGRDIFLEWAGRYPGRIDPAEDARVFNTITTTRTGWRELWGLAEGFGFNAGPERAREAQADFGAVPDLGTTVPGLATVEDWRTKLVRMLGVVRDAEDTLDRSVGLMNLRKAGFSNGEIRAMMIETAARPARGVMTLGDWLKSPELLKPPEPAVPYLTWPGLKTILSAREKMGKSTLALAGVAAATRGETFLGERTTPQRVLWLSEEPIPLIVQRAHAFGCDMDRLAIEPMEQNPQAQLKRAIDAWGPSVVVIDTLYRFAGVEGDAENDAGTWMPILLLFDEITRAGAALLILVHAQKHSEGGEYRGSSAIGGFVDAILEVRRPREGGEHIRKISGRGRLHFGKGFAVRLLDEKTGHHELLEDADAAIRKALGEQIVAYVREHPGENYSTIRDAVGGEHERFKEVYLKVAADEKFEKVGRAGVRLPSAQTEMAQ